LPPSSVFPSAFSLPPIISRASALFRPPKHSGTFTVGCLHRLPFSNALLLCSPGRLNTTYLLWPTHLPWARLNHLRDEMTTLERKREHVKHQLGPSVRLAQSPGLGPQTFGSPDHCGLADSGNVAACQCFSAKLGRFPKRDGLEHRTCQQTTGEEWLGCADKLWG